MVSLAAGDQAEAGSRRRKQRQTDRQAACLKQATHEHSTHLSSMPRLMPSSSHRGLAFGAAASRAFCRLRSSATLTFSSSS